MYYKGYTVVGVVNDTTLDDGVVSLVEAPIRIEAVIIDVDTYEGNIIEGWIGTDRVLEIYDYNLDTHEESTATQAPRSATKMGRIPIGIEIPAGQKFKIGVRCGAAANDLFGSYEYEKVSA